MSAPGLQVALDHMRQGRPELAAQLCRQLVAADPQDFGARHLLGIALLARGDYAGAESQLARAVALDPSVAGVHYNHGNALQRLGRFQQAVASYDAALHCKPDFAEALRNRGDAQLAMGNAGDAADSYRQALAQNPRFLDARLNLGDALLRTGRHAEALASFDQFLANERTHAGAWNQRGSALYALGRMAESLDSYERAVALAPQSPEPHDNRGLVLQAMGRMEEAVASHGAAITRSPRFVTAWIRRAMALRALRRYDDALADADQAVTLAPGDPMAHNARGIVLNDLARYEDALVDYGQALQHSPGFAEALNNFGNALYDLGRMDEALDALDRAIALRPGYAEALSNRGLVLHDTRRFDAAAIAYDTALASQPGHAEALKRRASLRLVQGDYAGGWADYGASLQHARLAPGIARGLPWWEGEPLAGKSILLSEPNGLGDTLQYWRFIPQLQAMGAEVAFLCKPSLFALLRSSPWPVRLLSEVAPSDAFDLRCELWSVPRLLGTTPATIPTPVPYFAVEAERIAHWAARLPEAPLRIGVCWQGNPERKIDAGRSIPLAAFAPLSRVPGVRLVSLQKIHGLDQLRDAPKDMHVHDLEPGFDEGSDAFLDAAAVMASLDLVVSSDTAIAHLAGALGRPVWLGLKWMPEWRWMLDRDDSPWYPTMRLFRQPARGDWEGVFEAMARALQERVR